MQKAAVLVPLYSGDDGTPRLLLVRRSDSGVHAGQIAFPGGKQNPEDDTLIDTAQREAWEEIGLAPEAVEIIEHLPVVHTMSTGFLIYPFLARVETPAAWRREEREIAEILEVPVEDLLRPEAHGQEIWDLPGFPEPLPISFYRVGPYKLWGATYRILRPLLPRLAELEWPV